MDANRPPGPQCQTRTPCDINDGTTVRARSPKPGPIRHSGGGSAPQPPPQSVTPRVTNWPSKLSWRQFRVVKSPPPDTTEDAQTAADIQGSQRVAIGKDKAGLF